MKRILLGTTALVAAGAFAAGTATADEMMAEPVSVGVGGYTTGAMYFASDGDDDKRSHAVEYVFEVGISGSTTLDNGITVAVSGQIGRSGKHNSAIDNFDEIHTTLSGSFGSLRLGRTESAAFNATVAAPGAAIGGMIGVNYDWFAGAGGSVNTYTGIGGGANEDSMKVVYTTPNFNGLTIGMSYAPNRGEGNLEQWDADGGGSDPTNRSTAGLGEHTAVGATYSTSFMEGGSLTLGAGYEMASDGADDPSATRAGVNVSVDEISFGGGMYDEDGSGMQFDVGASWTQGATEVGLQYANNETDNVSKAALHLTYTLGPGVLVGGQIAGISGDSMEDVTQLMLGTAVFF